MLDPIALAGEIMGDISLATDLIAKISGNIAKGKDVLSTTQLSDAKAKLAEIQQAGNVLDAEFDAALAAAEQRPD